MGAGAIWKDVMLICLCWTVVCIQLHINSIYGFCTDVLNIYSFLDAYKQCILWYVYFENRLLFNVIISRCDAVVQ